MRARLFGPAVLITFQAVFVQVTTVAIFAVQASYLGPHDFGLIAAVMIFIGFCETLFTGVLQDTLISVGEITDLHYSTAFIAATLAAAAIGAATFLAADDVAALLRDPSIGPVAKLMSPLPLLSTLWVAPLAKTKRDMEFGPTLLRSCICLSAGGIVGVTLAVAGYGVWALVWQALVHRSTGAAALWLAVGLRFKLRCSSQRFREMTRIAGPLLASRCTAWASGQTTRLLIALYLGTVNLGLYSLGTRLTDILVKLTIEPRTVVARIGFRRFQTAPAGLLEQEARRLFGEVSLVCFPVCLGAAAVAPNLFHVWLDQRWRGALVPVQALLCTGVPYVTCYGASAILIALNRRRSDALLSALQFLAVTAALAAALPHGIDAASLALPLATAGMILPTLVTLKRSCGLAIGAVVGPQGPALVASLVMAACVCLTRRLLPANMPGGAELILLVVLGTTVYAALGIALAPRIFLAKSRSALALAGLRTRAAGS